MQWPQHPPNYHFLELDYNNNDRVQRYTPPMYFTCLLQLCLTLLQDTKISHLSIFGRCIKIIQMLAYFQHIIEIYWRDGAFKRIEHLQLIMWATLNQRHHHLFHSQTLPWSLTPYKRYGPRPETSVSLQRIYIYIYIDTYFF